MRDGIKGKEGFHCQVEETVREDGDIQYYRLSDQIQYLVKDDRGQVQDC